MKKIFKLFLSVLLLVLSFVSLVSCTNEPQEEPEQEEHIDYVSQLKLDMTSSRLKKEVTVKTFVDGDTTHFNFEAGILPNVEDDTVLKARYIAVDTPESTGQVEPYGKKASKFTKSKLEHAYSIIVESDTDEWNLDSTLTRFVVWVWYKPTKDSEYRNLNLEILQNGLAYASNTGHNSYGTTCQNALYQAKNEKLMLYSGVYDDEFYYGDVINLTLKEIRTNIEKYVTKKVSFVATVVQNYSNAVYVEEYDEETQMYFGMYVFYGYVLKDGRGLKIISTHGNRVRIAGNLQFYETGGTYQIADLKYDAFDTESAGNLKLIASDQEIAYPELTYDTLFSKVNVSMSTINEETQEEEIIVKQFDYAELALDSSITMKNLKVIDAYTTPQGSSKGAMTLTCTVDGHTITVRTVPLYKSDGKTLITQGYYLGKTIDVKGVIDYFDGEYQVKVFLPENITIH